MKNVFYLMMALLIAVTACKNTEVGVDEVKAPVKFLIAQPSDVELTLKSDVNTPSTLVDYPWISGINIDITPSTGSSWTENFAFNGTSGELIVNVPVGVTDFNFNTTCDVPTLFQSDIIAGELLTKVKELRDVDPYMLYAGFKTDTITYSDQIQTVPVKLNPTLGRIIITVDADQNLKDNYDIRASVIKNDVFEYLQEDVPMYGVYSGPEAVDGMQFQVAITVFDKGTDIPLRTVHTSIWGQPNGNQTSEDALNQSKKMQMEVGYDKWVQVKLLDIDVQGVNFSFDVKDLEKKKEIIDL